ncbi:MAG: NAD(P)-binding domain-containing protein [Methanobrevibacter sp.]|nr:NAD(P)-binding domain-containing protein [Methanobrevibacter sp.]
MRFGVIGYGNIGQLICKNLESIGFLEDNILNISNKTSSKLKSLNPKINTYDDNIGLVKNSDVIFISVKSPDFINVLKEIKPYLNKNSYIVHSSAGIRFEDIEKVYGGEVSCVIPSIASWPDDCREKSGVSIFYHGKNTSNKNKQSIEDLFSKFSYVINCNNYDDLEALTVATSCMPAFISFVTSQFAKQLAKSSNLEYDDIYSYLNETNLATASLLKKEVFSSDELISKVATKNGITQKGLDYLDDNLPLLFSNLFDKLM